MTGWRDIDGSSVMAGSPGVLGCLDVAFDELLGSLPGQRNGVNTFGQTSLESVERLLKQRGDNEDLRERVMLAAEMVVFAQFLLDHPQDAGTDVDAARRLVANLRTSLPDRLKARGEYWWRKVDSWGNDGSPEAIRVLRERVAARSAK